MNPKDGKSKKEDILGKAMNESSHNIPVVEVTTQQVNNYEESNEIQITANMLSLKGHAGPVISADWLADGTAITSVSTDNSIWFWDTENGSCTHSFLNGALFLYTVYYVIDELYVVHEEGHSFTNINTDFNNMAITSSTDGIIRVWDKRTPKGVLTSILAHES